MENICYCALVGLCTRILTTSSVSIGLYKYFDLYSGCSPILLCIALVKKLSYNMAYTLLSPSLRVYIISICFLNYSWSFML